MQGQRHKGCTTSYAVTGSFAFPYQFCRGTDDDFWIDTDTDADTNVQKDTDMDPQTPYSM